MVLLGGVGNSYIRFGTYRMGTYLIHGCITCIHISNRGRGEEKWKGMGNSVTKTNGLTQIPQFDKRRALFYGVSTEYLMHVYYLVLMIVY